jgi:hypothetical protein
MQAFLIKHHFFDFELRSSERKSISASKVKITKDKIIEEIKLIFKQTEMASPIYKIIAEKKIPIAKDAKI